MSNRCCLPFGILKIPFLSQPRVIGVTNKISYLQGRLFSDLSVVECLNLNGVNLSTRII